MWSTRVALCGPRARLAYFAFYLTLCRGRTHQRPPLSFMFSRPESGSWLPADRHSRSDLAVRAAAIIPSAAFKHIPFALQFVQPGIVASPATPHHSPFTPRPHAVNPTTLPSPSSPASIPGLSCPLQGSSLCFFMSGLFFFVCLFVCFFSFPWQKSKVSERIPSCNPPPWPPSPPGKFHSYQGEHSCCESGCRLARHRLPIC